MTVMRVLMRVTKKLGVKGNILFYIFTKRVYYFNILLLYYFLNYKGNNNLLKT